MGKIRLVIYESGLAGWVVSFLQYLGLDFFESLEEYMIDEVYEIEVLLEDNGGIKKIVRSDWKKVLNMTPN